MQLRMASIFVLLAFTWVLGGCQEFPNQTPATTNSLGTHDINQWTTTPPSTICGTNGYNFILTQYIKPNCGSCHSDTGIAPYHFTSSNISTAINEALAAGKSTFLATAANNQFCGPGCNLTPGGQVYQGISQWFDNPVTCP